ncbi:MAG: CDP-alcohol phosphatidyltransferase family protein [Deltaproteobacteria bacterium]|nr:CDP-alcohol phosphatidyltransferase family protein [Deltaproteobacteria bacterium]
MPASRQAVLVGPAADSVEEAAPPRWLDRERLKRIRNFQSSEFYSRLVMRPLSVLLMLVCADWKWLTPNMVTTLANVFKLLGAALIVLDHREYALSAAIILQLGLLFDHVDGTLARYRKTGSTFGAFYDKVSDAVTWLVISGALGWAAYVETGSVWMPIGAIAAAYLLLVMGYMKWIVAAATQHTPATPAVDPPSRTPKQWAAWLLSSIGRACYFEEVDLFFWIGLGLLLDQLPLTILLLLVSQGVQMVFMIIKRGMQMQQLDAARARTISIAA